jgi:uncharacterized protein (DUF302 family)
VATFTLRIEIPLPFRTALDATRAALAEQGFGILTEIDLAATFKSKLDVDLPPQAILGACRPQLAYDAIRTDPALATVLPCNVVVRWTTPETTVVEALDPSAVMGLADNGALQAVAADARQRLTAALATLGRES